MLSVLRDAENRQKLEQHALSDGGGDLSRPEITAPPSPGEKSKRGGDLWFLSTPGGKPLNHDSRPKR